MDIPRRQLVAYALIGLALVGVGVVAAAHIAGTSPVSGGVPLVSPDGMNVTVTGDTNAFLESFSPTSTQVELITEDGNATFTAAGTANLSIHKDEIEGTWTNVSEVDADQNAITIDPEDKNSARVNRTVTAFAWRSGIQEDDGTVDFVYTASGTGEARVTGVSTNQQLVAVDADSGTFLDSATSDGSGTVTFGALDSGTHDVTIQAADFSDPVLSNPSPTGDLSNAPSSISVDVNDSDFPDGDSVDVVIELDGSQIYSTTITSNSTVSTSIPASGQTGGTHRWNVTATPDFGNPTTERYEYNVPSNLTIRNELNHTDIIESPVSSNVTFFGDDRIVTRQTSSGVIDLKGLPVNSDFIAEIEPSDDNLTQRTIWFESIYMQQDAYLLNTSAVQTIESRFVLNDPTAQFGPSTVLFIERPINVSGTTTWQTVHSDEFGAEGVTATLQKDQRYRLRLRAADGTQQVVGPYRSTANETVSVQPGTPGISLGDFEGGWAANAELNNQTLTYVYDDPQNETDQLTVWIHEKNNQSNRLVPNSTYFDLGSVSAQESLTANESEKTWVVNFIVDRGDDEFTTEVEVSNRRDLFGGIPAPWIDGIGIGLLILLAGAFSQRNAATGAVVVGAVGGILFFIGLLTGITTGIGVAIGIFVAVLNQLRTSAGP